MNPLVLCIGEGLVGFTPGEAASLRHAATFCASTAGAEVNVAIGLTRFGIASAWAGIVGDDPFGSRVKETLAENGVSTELLRAHPNAPTGIYFKPAETSEPVRYYRERSAGSLISPSIIDEWALYAQPVLVHITGVTAQISDSGFEAARHVILDRPFGAAAISFDVNYRAALASADSPTQLLELARRSDIVFAGRDEAARVWGTTTCDSVRELIPEPASVVVKDANLEAVEFTLDSATAVPAPTTEIVEPTGAGDAFAAGWLSAYLEGAAPAARLSRGHWAAGHVLRSTKDYLETEVAVSDALR